MSLRAGLAQIDITPPPGIRKVGWNQDIIADKILDPLFARAAVVESLGERIGFVQMDALYLNGACGNLQTVDLTGGPDVSREQAGELLAACAKRLLLSDAPLKRGERKIEFRPDVRLRCRSRIVPLPYRNPTEDQVKGTARGAQRYGDIASYERGNVALVEEIRSRPAQPAEVQVLSFDDWDLVGIPGELFVENGLSIKEKAYPRHALVVELANGAVGYIPHKAAFQRGGYETTFCPWSKLAPEAGEVLIEEAVKLTRE